LSARIGLIVWFCHGQRVPDVTPEDSPERNEALT